MPEYVQIQTYATCTQKTFTQVLQLYKEALARAGCKDQQVLSWFSQITWPASDDDPFGDIYASSFMIEPEDTSSIESAGIEVSLYLHSAVPSIEQQPFWLGFNLLFAVDTVKEHALSTYKVGVGATLWHIMSELIIPAHELGIYFTDDWQENRTWRALTEDREDPWFFDLAIFPRTLADHFSMVPAGFQGTVVDHSFAFAPANRWEQLPWLEASS